MDATADQISMLETVLASTNEGILVDVGGAVRLTNPQFYEIWRIPGDLEAQPAAGAPRQVDAVHRERTVHELELRAQASAR